MANQTMNQVFPGLANSVYTPNGLALFGGKYILGGQPTNPGTTVATSAPGATQRQPFTPNQFTQQQLAGLGAAPQWMMDAYTQKIGQMGGNANPAVPFAVSQSGFPGMGGKTAPTGGQ